LNVADRMSQHLTYVNWSLAKENRRSCTDRFKLPLLAHASQTYFTSWRNLSYNLHSKRKCSMSLMSSPQSWVIGWVRSVKSFMSCCKNRQPYNLHCVGANVKPCSINQSAVRHCQAYPVLMSIQHGVIEKKSYIAYCIPIVWKIQFTTDSQHNIKGCSPDVRSLPSGLPRCSALLGDEFL